MPNPMTEFFYAIADIRNKFEEVVWGRALTPEQPGVGDPLGRFEASVENLGDRVDNAFDKLFDDLAKERASRGEPDRDLEQGIDR